MTDPKKTFFKLKGYSPKKNRKGCHRCNYSGVLYYKNMAESIPCAEGEAFHPTYTFSCNCALGQEKAYRKAPTVHEKNWRIVS